MVISVCGPSKSGKTVLIKKVIPEDCIIPVVGAGVQSADDLWRRVLQWMDVPAEIADKHFTETGVDAGIKGGGKIGLPLVAQGSAEGEIGANRAWGNEQVKIKRNDGIVGVIDEISESDFVVFIDDFHYIREEIREEIGRQIKVATERAVKIVTASVPHRVDDVVRSNPELRGRVAAVDLGYWEIDELMRIARQGFNALNAEISPELEQRLATEALGSPQLMQSICLNLCHVVALREHLPDHKRLVITEEQVNDGLLRTSSVADFSKMVSSLQSGPRSRGQERKLHHFDDGSTGDVYRSILLATSRDPIRLSFSYENIINRIRNICIDGAPAGSSVTSALEQMHVIAEDLQPSASPIAWDGDNLDIVDPYLLFFLRCSQKLASLGDYQNT